MGQTINIFPLDFFHPRQKQLIQKFWGILQEMLMSKKNFIFYSF